MPTYDYVCPEGHVFDGLYRREETVVPCRGCLGEPGIASGYTELQLAMARAFFDQQMARAGDLAVMAYRALLAMPSWMRRNANPLQIVVHRDPKTGEFRFPAHTNAPMPDGFERVEVADAAHARRIEKQVREREEAKARQYQYAKQAQRDAMLKPSLDDLRSKMGGFSKFGKEFAQVAIERAQKKTRESKVHVPEMEVGFEALSYDSSNRAPHADKATDWKAVKR